MHFVIGSLVLVLSAAPAPPAPDRNESKRLLADLYNKAKQNEKAERFERAEYYYRKLAFATGAKKFHKKFRALAEDRFDRLMAEAAAAANGDDAWAEYNLLDKAFRADPDRTEAAERFEELGYRWTRNGWSLYETDTSLSEEERAAVDEQARRDRLRVRPNFEKIERNELSIYTDVDTKQARSTLKQMVNANLSGFRVFREVMSPLSRLKPDQVVLVYFQKKEDYHRVALAPAGSAGVYYSDRMGGYFYEPNFPTMLHEMAHQYTDLVLSGIHCDAWFVEGIAEYFGAASMSHGGKRMKVGIPDSGRLGSFKELAFQGNAVPLDRFQSMDTNLQSELYAQAWALTYYLMEIHPAGRLYLFDYVAHANGLAYDLGESRDMTKLSLAEVMKLNDSSLEELEKQMFAHYGVRQRSR